MFFWNSYFFNDLADVGNLISGSSAFSKSSLNIWKFKVDIHLKPVLENFEHYLASVWDESNCAVVWKLLGIAFLWDWNENWPFPVLWPLLWKCCTQCASKFGKQQWPQDWKRPVFIPIPKKGSAKECSNYCTTALISLASKVMLKILQARLQ